MIGFLWSNRETPPLASKRWLVVWAKRILTGPGLIRILFRIWRLRRRGASIAGLAIVESCVIQGPGARLSIGRGSFVGLGTQMMLHDQLSIGECVVINRGVTILTASHDIRDPAWRMVSRPVVIGDFAWIATGAMLLPGVRIGRGAVVGAGAVIRENVPDYAIVTGNPGKVQSAERCRTLDYQPVAFAAPVEAWLGRPGEGGTSYWRLPM